MITSLFSPKRIWSSRMKDFARLFCSSLWFCNPGLWKLTEACWCHCSTRGGGRRNGVHQLLLAMLLKKFDKSTQNYFLCDRRLSTVSYLLLCNDLQRLCKALKSLISIEQNVFNVLMKMIGISLCCTSGHLRKCFILQ